MKILSSFDIPLQEFEAAGVNTDQLLTLLELINAPIDCSGLLDAAWSMQYAVRSIKNLGVNSELVNDLAEMLRVQSI